MSQIKAILRRLVLSAGIEIHRDWLQDFLLQAKRAGFTPAEIYDIGANRGHWTRATRELFPMPPM